MRFYPILVLIIIFLATIIIPDILMDIYGTWFGRILLVLIGIYMWKKGYSRWWVLMYIVCSIILVRIVKEGFIGNIGQRIADSEFYKLQSTTNKDMYYDLNVMRNTGQINQADIDYYNLHKEWKWSPDTITAFKNAVMNNKIVQMLPDAAVMEYKKLYPEETIKYMIAQ